MIGVVLFASAIEAEKHLPCAQRSRPWRRSMDSAVRDDSRWRTTDRVKVWTMYDGLRIPFQRPLHGLAQ